MPLYRIKHGDSVVQVLNQSGYDEMMKRVSDSLPKPMRSLKDLNPNHSWGAYKDKTKKR